MPGDAMSKRTIATRRHNRGAIFVESLIVVGLTTLLLATGIFFHFLYIHKLSTMREARRKAWAAASEGCNGGITGGGYDAVHNMLQFLAGEDGDGRIDQMGQNSPLGSVADRAGHHSSEAPAPALLHLGNVPIASSTRVACNENNPEGDEPSADAVGIFRWGWREFVP
jgi:hypothetical protein